jgi:2Fe-2S ferredoxin
MDIKKHQALFYFEDQPLAVTRPDSLLQTLLDHRIRIDHSCGGFATCGTCRVIVESDVEILPARNELESLFAEERGFQSEERLSCQLPCQTGLQISRPHFFKMKKGLE